MNQLYFDIALYVSIWVGAQIAFHGYEAHVSLAKRITKFLVLSCLLFAIYRYAGRAYFYGVLGLLSVGIGILHGYWFHYKHGIHWRKAEPREKYYQLIGKK